MTVVGECVVHRLHSPHHRTVEEHHVIPVAWQLRTPVATPPYPGRDGEGRGMLWDDRTVTLCPTGHRNVHYWIVRLMHALNDANSEEPQVALARVRAAFPGGQARELPIAVLALERFAGFGQLSGLIAAGEWGES